MAASRDAGRLAVAAVYYRRVSGAHRAPLQRRTLTPERWVQIEQLFHRAAECVDADWMEQVARNASMQDTGYLNGCRYLLQDRDQKFCRQFRETLAAGGVKCLPLPARVPI